ncbi:type II toxin-antitoxin system HipA family toxin [Rhizobium leguminosarum]|uniref:type II toxin-antitoxin system HipA family toxin n=1 Tax=Rhizobium leguminosarum TaxID=384 RepID=UPI001C91FB79|nr:type II toxin-antitoxin system HipA family toxin [Rhizobium leguminosarum]MBY3179438.1 type II toxin-antitoxin system HipA family toxin [Rhizobium leguminosarum]MBY5549602.1 type II toxin-antitoxin system HipA family toxin [Rhizobium leguminosarum]MBY5666491.1 type II toxin-antitoxin system HipA family toxin [Rhizobium leguminosarum]MBY5679815.1 type II toxin-antitoxin system HipA family toxin [Rhizobium leguminosarum]MBY5698111.1 type II toxin-antitoxin system HipA family toxin [Rhizobium 
MTFKPIRKMSVVLDLVGSERNLGTLAWSSDERRAYFEYSAEFLAAPLPVSPFNLKENPGLIAAPRDPFDGLHGLFNDSLPDGWGRLLLDRRLQKAGIDYHLLTPLDRLSAVGKAGMGGLSYIPELADDERKPADNIDWDWFVEQVDLVQAEMDIADIDTLQGAQGGSAGARPKIMIGFNKAQNTFALDYGQDMEPGFDRWMVKARGVSDPIDIGVEEQAYALMARSAGLEMAETRIFDTRKGSRLFATKRFDRTPAGRLHMHTASGILNASHRQASLNYGQLHKLTLMMTRDSSEVLRMFRRMVFNVYARNRDDHAKNHAFLMNADGRWTLSPAYDLTFSSGPGGEHSVDIAGEGRNPDMGHLLTVSRQASISDQDARDVIDQVRTAIEGWQQFAEKAGLSESRTTELDRILN